MKQRLVAFLVAVGLGCSCGSVEAKTYSIVSGTAATQGQVYGTVAIVDKGTSDIVCSGTLIAPQVVVSAAHCFYELDTGWMAKAKNFEVITDTLKLAQAKSSNRYSLTAILVHKSYTDSKPTDSTGLGKDNDISLVLLSSAVDELTPILLLPPELFQSAFTVGRTYIVAGYGATSQSDWKAEYGTLYWGEVQFEKGNSYEILLSSAAKVDTCFGDSGGPAYVELGSVRYLAGITSRARLDGKLDCGDGGMYTLASAYQQWIVDNSQGLYDPAPVVVEPGADVNTPTPDVNTPTPDVDTPTPDVDTPTPDVSALDTTTGVPDLVVPGADTTGTTDDLTSPTDVALSTSADTTGDVSNADSQLDANDSSSQLVADGTGGSDSKGGCQQSSSPSDPILWLVLLVGLVLFVRRRAVSPLDH